VHGDRFQGCFTLTLVMTCMPGSGFSTGGYCNITDISTIIFHVRYSSSLRYRPESEAPSKLPDSPLLSRVLEASLESNRSPLSPKSTNGVLDPLS
jgi:hypothetical protein